MSKLEDIFYKIWNFVPRADDSLHNLHVHANRMLIFV